MNESEQKLQGTIKVSKTAICAMTIGIFGPLCGFIVIVMISIAQFALLEGFSPFFLYPCDALTIGYLVSWLPAYLVGQKALREITVSGGLLLGTGCAKFGIKAAIVWAVLLPVALFIGIFILMPVAMRPLPSCTCGSNLSGLGKALMIYADEHGAYPAPDKWCDALLQGEYATEKMFKCPGNKKARCSYSINPNCEPNSEPNTVLVFESKGGWNSFGGPELFTTEYHKNEGSNILYNDCHVKFENTDPNGHFNFELNWGEKSKGRDLK